MVDLFQPTPAELRDRFLRDLRLGAIDTGVDEPPTQPGSDYYILATAVGNIGLTCFANVNDAEKAHSVLDAEGEDLDRIREADGLPEVVATGSSGKVFAQILGATTIPNGTPLTLPNGLALQTVGAFSFTSATENAEIDVEAVDTGALTNLGAGETVRFAPAPTNVATDATVTDGYPLRGGTDAETDARKRDRILNARRNRPGGGNWGQLREWALESLGSVQDCYVFPAIGGPGSCKVVPVRPYDTNLGDYSRALSTSEAETVRTYIQSKMPVPQEVVIQTVADDPVDVSILVTLPESALSGGNGQGWTDPTPWPPLVGADSGRVTISAVAASNDQITVTANTTTAVVEGQTHIAWWSSTDRRFYTRLVTLDSGSAGAWVLTLDSPLIGKTGDGPAVGDFICPAAFNLEKYGDAWVSAVGAFGPGENTTDTGRLPRAKRHPFTTDEDPIDVTNATIANWQAGFAEITGFALSYSNKTTPTVPASVDTAPNVLTPRHFALYKQ